MGSSRLRGRQATFILKAMSQGSKVALWKISLMSAIFLLGASCQKKSAAPDLNKKLVIATYSSLGSDHGFLGWAKQEFEKATPQCQLELRVSPGATQLIAEIERDSKKPTAEIHLAIGLDDLLYARSQKLFHSEFSTEAWNGVAASLKFKKEILKDLSPGFLPFDYGALTLIYSKNAVEKLNLKLPTRLSDLIRAEYGKKFIVQDPRVSSPGLVFFRALGDEVKLNELSPQWRLLAQSWDTSYQMFLAGEAPMVWSYLSSMAYHESKGEGAKYGWVQLADGLPLQREGMAVMKSVPLNPNELPRCLESFLRFVYSDAAQAKIYEKQFMFSVIEGVTVPAVFEKIEKVRNLRALEVKLNETDAFLKTFAQKVQLEQSSEK